MRLSTLARKIDKTPTQLIAFLEQKGIELENGLHSKLDSTTVDLVKDTYLPEEKQLEKKTIEKEKIEDIKVEEKQIVEEKTEDVKIDEIKIDEKQLEEKEIEVEEIVEKNDELPILPETEKSAANKPEVPETINEPKTGTLDDLENENLGEIELIKAKKVKLDGIKVVGKIELPEKPKKEIAEPKEETTESKTIEKPKKQQKSINRSFDRNRKKSPRGRSRSPLSYEEKLKKEEQEKRRKRRQIDKAEKKRKKKYYEKNLKPKTLSTPRKKKQQSADAVSNKKIVVHKNPLKRLWFWLNGDYDRF